MPLHPQPAGVNDIHRSFQMPFIPLILPAHIENNSRAGKIHRHQFGHAHFFGMNQFSVSISSLQIIGGDIAFDVIQSDMDQINHAQVGDGILALVHPRYEPRALRLDRIQSTWSFDVYPTTTPPLIENRRKTTQLTTNADNTLLTAPSDQFIGDDFASYWRFDGGWLYVTGSIKYALFCLPRVITAPCLSDKG